MTIIGLQGLTVALSGCLEVFYLNVLVTLKSVSVGEEWIKLQGSSKELQSSFMFLLHAITVTKNDPSLRLVGRSLQSIIRNELLIDKLLEMPQTGGVVFQTF